MAKEIFILDDDISDFLNKEKKTFVNKKNIIQLAMREFMAKVKSERHEKMMKLLNLPK